MSTHDCLLFSVYPTAFLVFLYCFAKQNRDKLSENLKKVSADSNSIGRSSIVFLCCFLIYVITVILNAHHLLPFPLWLTRLALTSMVVFSVLTMVKERKALHYINPDRRTFFFPFLLFLSSTVVLHFYIPNVDAQGISNVTVTNSQVFTDIYAYVLTGIMEELVKLGLIFCFFYLLNKWTFAKKRMSLFVQSLLVILLVTTIFGLIHAPQYNFTSAGIIAFDSTICVASIVYYRTILPTIVAHALYDYSITVGAYVHHNIQFWIGAISFVIVMFLMVIFVVKETILEFSRRTRSGN